MGPSSLKSTKPLSDLSSTQASKLVILLPATSASSRSMASRETPLLPRIST